MLFFFIAFIFLAPSYAGDIPGKSVERVRFAILKDQPDSSVKPDKCKITGTVYHYGQKYGGGLISTLDRESETYANDTGYFELLVDDGDTTIFFFQEELEEIVIWNYRFKGGHHVDLAFYPGVDINTITVDKPVIYLYAENDLTLDLTLDPKVDLGFTYPAYENGWSIELKDNTITDVTSGITVPYLFWEGTTGNLDFISQSGVVQGYFVSREGVVQFLELTLEGLGLNPKEKTDFITFWAPRMMKSPYVLCQFLLDEDYERHIGGIKVSQQPDSMRRIYLLFAPYEENTPPANLMPQLLPGFERTGFTLIEWGGSEIKPLNQL